MISFPVFERVRVSNYALYVGTSESPGLDHTFCPGVNVIVGINGLGKTTLLNILLRALTGPFDVPGDDALGDKKRRLVAADRHWFRKRVPDDAVAARVTVWFYLGQHYIELTRSLANLDLVELSIDQQPVRLTRPAELEVAYREYVMRGSGLSSFDDFLFLLRYVVFYLEDRRNLVWDTGAQGEILSILFGDQRADRREYVSLYNNILSKDSEYRNMRAVVRKQQRQAQAQAAGVESGQVDMIIKSLEERRKDLVSATETKNAADKERDSLREQIENRRLEIHDRRTDLARELNSFYESFFPDASDSARYLLAHFEAGTGCLVCASKDPKAVEEVNSKLYLNICPVCASPIEHSKTSVHDPYAGENIEQARADLAKAEQELDAMLPSLKQAEQTYADAVAQMVHLTAEVVSLEQQLDAFVRASPDAENRRTELQKRLVSFEAALNELEVELMGLAKKFQVLAEAIDDEIRIISAPIEEAFSRYISGFLAEQCSIAYTARQGAIGQLAIAEPVPFPHFVPALTSGVHRDAAKVREFGQSVSESQKEFIDLAFRMALLEVAAPNAPSMLILETPEASLDSVFVPRAGDLLRRFAARGSDAGGTRLIASSNVNRELMIPALFGAYPDQEFYGQVIDEPISDVPEMVPMDQRAKHVLDLLTVAAPTRALNRFRAAYEHERDLAIYPERAGEVGA